MNYDNRNYRKHSKRSNALIEKSLSDNGAGRSITLDSEENIICGNGVYKAAAKLKREKQK
ncbi:putative sulfiredoxin super family [Candidatus Termititenax aidoneus]|uniref:Sulfiredoxin super family n=1 Tax=Termititenax aidoneus TaxID=2218524 RepID=A0A388TET2_TERA1|nr:putative sulfiredoxin super family [Candidatus Termititenax aidoneus]